MSPHGPFMALSERVCWSWCRKGGTHLRTPSFGLRVLGFRVEGFRVQDLGFRVWGIRSVNNTQDLVNVDLT